MMPDSSNKILLLEDDENSATLITDYLKANGFYVECINNGDFALQKIETDNFDLVILDLRIPGQNGFMVAESLRESQKGAALPIIVVSAFADDHNKIRAYKAGATFFLSKPIDNFELLFIIRNLLTQQELNFTQRLEKISRSK
jgi:DNA-binding response OmpR family regulator